MGLGPGVAVRTPNGFSGPGLDQALWDRNETPGYPLFNNCAEISLARYHFNVVDRHGTIPDEEGANFAFFSQALTEAEDSARDLAKHLLENRVVLLEQCVEIIDDAGRTVAALPVIEVLRHPKFPNFQKHC